MKVLDGGYVPLILASAIYGIMLVWHRGSMAIAGALNERIVPVAEFLATIAANGVPRVSGTAVFLTRTMQETPPVMIWHVKRNKVLHEHLFVLTAKTEPVPWIDDAERLIVAKLAPNFWRATARFGFMERPDLPKLLHAAIDGHGCKLDLSDVTYYVGHETVVARDDGHGLMPWEEALFATMQRNAVHVTDFFRLPSENVVEIGRQVAI